MIPDVRPQALAQERYERLLALMKVSERITDKGWRIDRLRLQEHRAVAHERVQRFREMFLRHTGLVRSDLGASESGTTNRVRDWFWIGEGAPQLVYNKLTKKPQFSTELLIAYAQDFAKQRFGVAAAALYGLRKNKKLIEFCETYARFASHDGRIYFSFNPAGTQTGRWTSSTKMRVVEDDGSRTTYSCNAQQVPSKTPSFDFGEGKVQLVSSLRDIFLPDEGCVLMKCIHPSMRVLTADLRWVAASDLKKGQKLIGFDRDPNPVRRYYKPSQITRINSVYKSCYEIKTSMGTLICSDDHKWLASKSGQYARGLAWTETKDIKKGYTLAFMVRPFAEDRSYEAGYLSGFLDGEGHLNAQSGQVGFSQNAGAVFDSVKQRAEQLGLKLQAHIAKNQRGCLTARFGGEANAGLRVLGILRPPRLMKKYAEIAWKHSIHGKLSRRVKVLGIKPIGRRKCIAFSTTTRTFVCEGFASHNCDFEALEARLIAYIHGARTLQRWIDDGEDIHINTARAIFRELGLPADARQVKPALTEMQKLINQARDAAKPMTYAVAYQMHSEGARYITLYKTLKKIFPSITEQQVNAYAERFFELHPEIKQGQTRVKKSIERHGYARLAIDGRCLYYPNTPRGQNQALNFHMQATGAALINRATVELDGRLDWAGQEIRAQVHDELVVQAPVRSMERVKAWIEEAMSRPAQIGDVVAGVPATADPGWNWGSTMDYAQFKERYSSSGLA